MLISKKLLKRIEEKKKTLDSHRPLDKLQLEVLKEKFVVEYVYNSTSIEGNTLTLNETKLILQEGITIGKKSMREHLDVTNQKEAFEWMEEFIKKMHRSKASGTSKTLSSNGKELTESDILHLHKLTLKGISDHWAGRYKTSQNRILGSKLKTVLPDQVHIEVRKLIDTINKNPKGYNPIELTTIVHHEIARIHPFVDGNGRTARLLCNLILMKKGYPPIIIRTTERKKYFDCLEKANFGNLKPFAEFIALRVEESLIIYLNALTKTTEKNELIPLSELEKKAPYSQEYLSLLARKGILPATKINNIWHSTEEELEKYITHKNSISDRLKRQQTDIFIN